MEGVRLLELVRLDVMVRDAVVVIVFVGVD